MLPAASGSVVLGASTASGGLKKPGHVAVGNVSARGFKRSKGQLDKGAVVISSVPLGLRVSKGILRPFPGGLIVGTGVNRGTFNPLGPFPDVAPTKRKFTPPKYHYTETITDSGVKETRLWNALPTRATLELLYENESTDLAEEIVSAFERAFSTINAIVLPPKVFIGYDPDLAAYVRGDSSIKWTFKAEPRVEFNQYYDTCTINVAFYAQSTGILSIDSGGEIGYITLPIYTPTTSTYTAPKLTVTEASLFGTDVYKTGLNNLPYGSLLELTYTNVDDAVALEFLKAYRNTFTRLFPVLLSPEHVRGILNVSLATRILRPLGLSWFFKEGPEIESIIRGVSSFSVVLEALIIATPPAYPPLPPVLPP